LWSLRAEPGLGEGDRLLAVTTLSFDIAGVELYLPLLVGGVVALASRAEAGDAGLLRRRLETEPVTVMQATPTTWRMLVAAGWGISSFGFSFLPYDGSLGEGDVGESGVEQAASTNSAAIAGRTRAFIG